MHHTRTYSVDANSPRSCRALCSTYSVLRTTRYTARNYYCQVQVRPLEECIEIMLFLPSGAYHSHGMTPSQPCREPAGRLGPRRRRNYSCSIAERTPRAPSPHDDSGDENENAGDAYDEKSSWRRTVRSRQVKHHAVITVVQLRLMNRLMGGEGQSACNTQKVSSGGVALRMM